MLMKSNGQSVRKSLGSLRVRVENYCYHLNEKLGSGYSSEVFRGWDDRSGRPVAIKVINLHRVRERGLSSLLANQLRLLKELRHPHLVHYIDAFMTVNNCYIVTEFCQEGDLGSLLQKRGRQGIDEAIRVILDMLSAVSHLHQRGIVHRDIKPQNILLQEGRAQLADFGFAIRAQNIAKESLKIGTPLYMSPQSLLRKEYCQQSDVWSLGMTIYELLEGKAPWPIHNEKDLKRMFKEQIKFDHLKCQEIQKVVLGCLRYEKEERMSAEEALRIVETLAGVGGQDMWEVSEDRSRDKENNENVINVQRSEVDEEVKKSIKVNYSILKWMINYSRFSAKLLPKIELMSLSEEEKGPFVELAARCLYMTISKLNRVEQMSGQLGLSDFPAFKKTHKFAKIKAVTAEYHQKYLLMLTKLTYTYQLSPSLCLNIQEKLLDSLEKLNIDLSTPHSTLSAIQGILALVEANVVANSTPLLAMSEKINFQKMISVASVEWDEGRVEKMRQKRREVLGSFGRKMSGEQVQPPSN